MLQMAGGNSSDGRGVECDGAGPPPLMPLMTAADQPAYDYAGCDVVKV